MTGHMTTIRSNMIRRMNLTVRAAWHELSCAECRVSWKSWTRRIVGDPRGFNPRDYG